MINLKTEEKILKAAFDTFLLYGFHGTTIQQIADRAKVKKATVHYYFRLKERLYEHVLKMIFDYIDSIVFVKQDSSKTRMKVNWFLFTEKYNNQTMLERALIELGQNHRIKFINEISLSSGTNTETIQTKKKRVIKKTSDVI